MLNGDAISMPGNQGGSNWGTTAADPQRGLVFVTGVNQVAMLRVNDIEDPTVGGPCAAVRAGNNNPPPNMSQVAAGQKAYATYCAACHGADQRPTDSGHPVARRASRTGSTRRACASSSVKAATTCARSSTRRTRTSRRFTPISRSRTLPVAAVAIVAVAPAMALPPGPVVATGGVPRPQLPARYGGPFFPGVGGTTGNMPWPADVEAAKLTEALPVGLQRHGDVDQAAVHDDHRVRPEHR